jgi:hypothetical protein
VKFDDYVPILAARDPEVRLDEMERRWRTGRIRCRIRMKTKPDLAAKAKALGIVLPDPNRSGLLVGVDGKRLVGGPA